jgi:phosphohistidine phosphatase
MRLTIVRHGIAEDNAPDGGDAGRRLTTEGVEKSRKVGVGLARISKPAQRVLSSPKVRAEHTARIIADAFDTSVEVVPELQSEDPELILEMLSTRKEETLVIVGHEPTLGALVELLIAGSISRGSTPMKKAGAACFEVSFGRSPQETFAELKWFIPPDVLGRI